MNLNFDLWLKLVNAVVLVGSVAVNVYLYFKSKTDDRFAELDAALSAHDETFVREQSKRLDLDRRLVKLETEFEAAPKHDDIDRIQEALRDLGADVSTVKERSMNSLQSLRRIEQHLLERSK